MARKPPNSTTICSLRSQSWGARRGSTSEGTSNKHLARRCGLRTSFVRLADARVLHKSSLQAFALGISRPLVARHNELVDKGWPNSAQIRWTDLATLGRSRPIFAEIGSTLVEVGPALVLFGRCSAEFDGSRPNLTQLWWVPSIPTAYGSPRIASGAGSAWEAGGACCRAPRCGARNRRSLANKAKTTTSDIHEHLGRAAGEGFTGEGRGGGARG